MSSSQHTTTIPRRRHCYRLHRQLLAAWLPRAVTELMSNWKAGDKSWTRVLDGGHQKQSGWTQKFGVRTRKSTKSNTWDPFDTRKRFTLYLKKGKKQVAAIVNTIYWSAKNTTSWTSSPLLQEHVVWIDSLFTAEVKYKNPECVEWPAYPTCMPSKYWFCTAPLSAAAFARAGTSRLNPIYILTPHKASSTDFVYNVNIRLIQFKALIRKVTWTND